MMEILKNSMVLIYGQLVLATVINMITVYCLKKADGFTHLWPSIGVVVSVSFVQYLVSRVMASGMDVGIAMVTVLVFIMIGSVLMGFIVFNETLSFQKVAGLTLAIIGVTIASLSKS
jgi:multidrug transporter EmrE-like cation transporter